MFKRRHFFRWRRFYLLAGVLLLFGSAFTLWNLSASSVIVSRIVGYVRAVNLAKILDYTFLPLNAYFNHLVNPPEIINNRELLNQELRSLKQELFYKEREIVALKRIESENNYFRNILGYASNVKYPLTPARVISYEPQNHFTFFWINAGLNNGISENMPVVGFDAEGKESLIGYIEIATDKSSMVRTILDPQTHVGVLIKEYDSRGILRGDNELKQLLSVNYLSSTLTNLNNLNIVTSGIGERYPSGIFIGTIIEENSSTYGLFKKVTIKPAIDFYSLKDVFIIRNIGGTNAIATQAK